ncbi:MAG: transposase [Pirellulales bacterium]|nr:transposase [Pirellulales bacterium]
MAEVTTESIAFPGTSRGALAEILKAGAQRMLAQAIEAEVAEWIDAHADVTDAAGRRQVVRNGYLPERTIVTGVGEIPVRQPRVHDRRPEDEREKFTSQILPPYLRKAKNVEELIPFLYLKGIGTGDMKWPPKPGQLDKVVEPLSGAAPIRRSGRVEEAAEFRGVVQGEGGPAGDRRGGSICSRKPRGICVFMP